MGWNLNQTQSEIVAEETGVQETVVSKVINLFEQGNEIAYVARYRVDAHQGLPCDKVRQIFEAYQDGKEVNEKVGKAIVSVQKKAGSEEDANAAVEQLRNCREPAEVVEVTKIFATAKKTKASQARTFGLGEAAEKILAGEVVKLAKFVDKENKEMSSIEKVETHLKFLMADCLNKLPQTIETAKKISHLETDAKIRISTTVNKDASDEDRRHFAAHIAVDMLANNAKNDKILAILRAEEKEVLSWVITVEGVEHKHPGKQIRVAKPHIKLFEESLSYSISHFFIPKIKRAVKTYLSKRAEQAAIDCFSRNLLQLFSQAGLKNTNVIALDPGYNACKVAALDSNGTVIDTATLPFRNKGFDNKSVAILQNYVEKMEGSVIIAIGNGSASTETQIAVENLISKNLFKKDVRFCVVSESGASKYSITDLAEEELPGIPVTEKSAVSIGRRLIDPVAEYVKIEPKHLGLGMYQHSVNEKKLSEALALVVRDCVSLRGVDVNSASPQLLQQVCGLNKKSAAGIISLRKKLERISSRSQLKEVKGLGPKAFQQAAGFLLVLPSQQADEAPPTKKRKKNVEFNPLDATTVHPEDYELAEKLLVKAKVDIENLKSDKNKRKLRSIEAKTTEEKLVIDLLTADPVLTPPPPLITEVRKINTLKVGEKILGRVMNNTDFGSFIDIGAECNALAHVNCLNNTFPEVGTQLLVRIKTYDAERKRISVVPCL